MKKFKLLAVIMAFLTLFCGCADKIPEPLVSEEETSLPIPDQAPVPQAYPVSVDNETFESAPATVASLSPALTEMMYDLSLSDRLVAVSDYCDYPESLSSLQKAGSPAEPKTDVLTSLAPELLITLSPIAATDILTLKQAGIRVMELKAPENFAELCDLYIKLALIFYGSVDGYTTAAGVYGQLDSALAEASSLNSGKTFVVVEAYASDGLMLSPKGTLSDSLFSAFGTNLWQEDKFNATEDELFEIGPDIVFYASGMDEDDIKKTFPYSKLIEIDFERVEKPSLRLVDMIKSCSAALLE